MWVYFHLEEKKRPKWILFLMVYTFYTSLKQTWMKSKSQINLIGIFNGFNLQLSHGSSVFFGRYSCLVHVSYMWTLPSTFLYCWDSFSLFKLGPIDGNLTANSLQLCLRRYFQRYSNCPGKDLFLFLPDNTPVHKARSMKTWFSQFGGRTWGT